MLGATGADVPGIGTEPPGAAGVGSAPPGAGIELPGVGSFAATVGGTVSCSVFAGTGMAPPGAGIAFPGAGGVVEILFCGEVPSIGGVVSCCILEGAVTVCLWYLG